MPRSRSRRQPQQPQQDQGEVLDLWNEGSYQSQTASQPQKERGTSMAVELTPEQIAELLAGARTKGAGDDVLKEFLASGAAGIEVDLESGPFAGKTPSQAATSLTNAKTRVHKEGPNTGELVYPDAKHVVVRKVITQKGDSENGTKEEGHVFMIDKSKVAA